MQVTSHNFSLQAFKAVALSIGLGFQNMNLMCRSRSSMNSTEKGKRINSTIISLFTLEEGFFTADLAARRRIQGDNFICHRLEFVVYNLNELKNYKEIKIK